MAGGGGSGALPDISVVSPLRGHSRPADLIAAVIAERLDDIDMRVLDHLELVNPSRSRPCYTLRTSCDSGQVFEYGAPHVLVTGRSLTELLTNLYARSGAVVSSLLYEWELANGNDPSELRRELPSGGPVPGSF